MVALVQLVLERLIVIQKVIGSNPIRHPNYYMVLLVRSGSESGCEPDERKFLMGSNPI